MQFNKNLYKHFKLSVIFWAMSGILLFAGCNRGPQSPTSPPVPEVTTVTVQPQKIMLETELSGRTSAYRVAEIRPQVSGLILKRMFTEGSKVMAGQILYQIDPAPFQAALENAKAALSRSEANLFATRSRTERYKDLLADKAVSQQDYDDSVANLSQVKADIQYWKSTEKTARINLGYTKVTAPISGRIGKSNITDGAIVTAYQPMAMATIQQLDPIYIDVPQSTTALLNLKSRLKNGLLKQNGADQNKVKLILEGNKAYPIEGILQFSDITVEPTTGSVILRIIAPNPEGILLPGMFIRAVIKEGINEHAILISQQSVSRDPKGNPFVLVIDAESKAVLKPLTLDRAIGNKWLISDGLVQGDRVIIEGLLMLRPGTVVKAVSVDKTQKGQDFQPSPDAKPKKNSKGGV